MKTTIMAGITKEDEIYFLEFEPRKEDHDYFAMSGFSVIPLKYDEAVKRNRESLEDGELWKMAVAGGNTTLGLDNWIDLVMDTDSEISMIDNSLLSEEVKVDGETYIFESGSCGKHGEADLNKYFIDKVLFSTFHYLWKTYHLKKDNPTLPELPEQDQEVLLIKAIKLINND